MDEKAPDPADETPPDEHEEAAGEVDPDAEAEAPEEAEEFPPQPVDPELAKALRSLAEEPGLYLAAEPKRMVFQGEGFAFISYGRLAWVQRLRLKPSQIEPTIDRVASILGVKGLTEASWWIGLRSRPKDLVERLVALGLEPDDPPTMTSLAIAKQPEGEPLVEVRRVETSDDFLRALELDWECFGVSEEERETRRVEAANSWATVEKDRRYSTFLAYIDGDPVGFGRSIVTPSAVLMMGGATLPEARGMGVYTALVHARWHEAVACSTPRLVVTAGPQSTPILRQLGFERINRVHVLKQTI